MGTMKSTPSLLLLLLLSVAALLLISTHQQQRHSGLGSTMISSRTGRIPGITSSRPITRMMGRIASSRSLLSSPTCSSLVAVRASDEEYIVDRNYNVVITGSTKGVGYALAEKFLEAGDSVVICSNEPQEVHDEVVAELAQRFGAEKVRGTPCDVGSGEQFDNLVDFTKRELGDIDIWINNAGGNLYRYGPLNEMDDRIIQATVDVNLVGTLLGCKRAINTMKEQKRGGHIFNMLGQGQDGAPTANVSVYGSCKRGLEQLNKSLRKELNVAKIDNVGVHLMSPGIVKTDLLMADKSIQTDKVKKFIINCLAEPAPDVAAQLVKGARVVPIKFEQEDLDGQKVPFLTPDKVLGKFAARGFHREKSRAMGQRGDVPTIHSILAT